MHKQTLGQCGHNILILFLLFLVINIQVRQHTGQLFPARDSAGRLMFASPENIFGQTKSGLSQTTISWPFSWTVLNQPWSWQHMHKITKSKSIHTHTIHVCVFLMFFFFCLTGRQWYFMQRRRGYEPSGRCSCSRGGAVMQQSLYPPSSSSHHCGSWAGNDLAWPQLFKPTILPPQFQNCRFQMLYQVSVSICNADSGARSYWETQKNRQKHHDWKTTIDFFFFLTSSFKTALLLLKI